MRISAAPLVLDGHLKAVPLRQMPWDSILQTTTLSGCNDTDSVGGFHLKNSSAADSSLGLLSSLRAIQPSLREPQRNTGRNGRETQLSILWKRKKPQNGWSDQNPSDKPTRAAIITSTILGRNYETSWNDVVSFSPFIKTMSCRLCNSQWNYGFTVFEKELSFPPYLVMEMILKSTKRHLFLPFFPSLTSIILPMLLKSNPSIYMLIKIDDIINI